jgi:hypothetical protein
MTCLVIIFTSYRHPRTAFSIVATSIFFIGIITSKARFAFSPPTSWHWSIRWAYLPEAQTISDTAPCDDDGRRQAYGSIDAVLAILLRAQVSSE